MLRVHTELTVDTFHPGFLEIVSRSIEIIKPLDFGIPTKQRQGWLSDTTGKEVRLSKRQSLLTQKYAHFADQTSLLNR